MPKIGFLPPHSLFLFIQMLSNQFSKIICFFFFFASQHWFLFILWQCLKSSMLGVGFPFLPTPLLSLSTSLSMLLSFSSDQAQSHNDTLIGLSSYTPMLLPVLSIFFSLGKCFSHLSFPSLAQCHVQILISGLGHCSCLLIHSLSKFPEHPNYCCGYSVGQFLSFQILL